MTRLGLMDMFGGMKTVRINVERARELTGMGVSLDIYVNNKIHETVAPFKKTTFTVPCETAEVFVKTNWCESNRITIDSDASFFVRARGGLLGAIFISVFCPKKTYVLRERVTH